MIIQLISNSGYWQSYPESKFVPIPCQTPGNQTCLQLYYKLVKNRFNYVCEQSAAEWASCLVIIQASRVPIAQLQHFPLNVMLVIFKYFWLYSYSGNVCHSFKNL